MNELIISFFRKVLSFLAFLLVFSISCSERTEIDVMNDIWEQATEWTNLIDQNQSAYSLKTGKIFNGWAKKTFDNGDFHILAQFHNGQSTRILQWYKSGYKGIDAGIKPNSIPFQDLPLQDLDLYLPFNDPIFELIQDHGKDKPITHSFHPPKGFNDFNGSVKTWYDNGCPKTISYWKDGSLEGNFTNYWNTQLVFHKPPIRIQGQMKNGKKQGNYIMSYVADTRVNKLEAITIYDLNFIAKFHGAYKDDLRTGKFEFFHGNGNKSESTFINDKRNGPSTIWNKSKMKISETFFTNGLKNGSHAEWYGNGNKKVEGVFDKGKKQGRFNFYNREGIIQYFQTFKDGKLTFE